MSGENGKSSRKPIRFNFTVMALLLVAGGFTLSACQQESGGKSPEQVDNQPAQSDQKQSDQKLQDKQLAKPDQKQSDRQPQDNQPAQSDQKQSDQQLKKNSPATSPQKNSAQKKNNEQDTQADDDPD